jgi:hypothetical protein
MFGVGGLTAGTRLLEVMHRSLGDILKAIKGLVVMSEQLEKMGTSMFNNQAQFFPAIVAHVVLTGSAGARPVGGEGVPVAQAAGAVGV